MVNLTNREWISILRLTPIVLGSILLLSAIDFGLAVTYAKQLYNAPLDSDKPDYSNAKRWPTAWFVLYSGLFPLLSLMHATIDSALFFLAQLSPKYTLTASVLFAVGWIVQGSFWWHCDYAPDAHTCYQFYIVGGSESGMLGSLQGVSDTVSFAKKAVGWILLVFYVIYLAMAAIVVRRMREPGHVRVVDDEDQDLERLFPTGYSCHISSDRFPAFLP